MASRTPLTGTPRLKSSVAPETPIKDATESTAPQTVPFPPPQTFEIIPPLHGILLRLLSQKNTASEQGNTTAPAGNESTQPQSQQPLDPKNGTGPSSLDLTNLEPNAHPPLDVKDLPTETSSVKIRLQKARTVVEGLPDVDRSVAEQQQEIEELEDHVARLRSVISDFGSRAGMKERVKMES
ncbi:hypothetical protein N7474_009872 [Penicillium riverlandense]|uniref:uncharacterized protein n=1 Tax=Penicillium riverlandense TaxID=1903569 RepID=UPI00254898EB|nr:uncharacterized protein N7474_009872 [Penicillium riverlandense]KAJ5808603.1 hypothetical protein N7474_009872 [Penicillium riverlandense]